ncbi:MAG: 4-hydroxybenzoyl-CoA reductase subunit alpha [Actinobacteria bacterium ADurb.Bin444]|nr:MAG: 4-hydroxybenzoyl-CoA reductase subunit alpha [Actinobacteria bacterium ADurb.Bin444]
MTRKEERLLPEVETPVCAPEELIVVGKRIPKSDALFKVLGQAKYIYDMQLPGMLYGKILWSDRAHAKILSIDTTEAEKVPGVRAVITAYNTPEIRIGFMKDQPVLKRDKVRSFRDEVAAVAATSWEAAEEAVSKIKVVYEDLPGVFSPEDAMAEGAPLIHEMDARGKELKDNRIRLPWKLVCGDLEKGKAEAAYTVTTSYECPAVNHCCLGTSACIASFDAADNLTIYDITQIPSLAKADFLEALKAMGLKGRVRVVTPTIGGGFGSKLDTYGYQYIAMLLSHRTKQPVKIVFTREEEFFATSPRQQAKFTITQGCDKEGYLTFREVDAVLDNGAYISWGATTPSVMMMPMSSLYRVPNVQFKATCIYTNNTWAQAMRGYGNPQATMAIDCNLDELAEKAGIDPAEMRRRNAGIPGEETPQGFLPKTCGHRECLEAVVEKIGFANHKSGMVEGTPKARGMGLASLIHVGGGAKIYRSDGCATSIKIDDAGWVDVFSGSQDIGQGLDTVLRQIVAEVLGFNPEKVIVHVGDTDTCGWDAGCHASRSTFVAGNSAKVCAEMVRAQMQANFAAQLELPEEAIDIKAGMVLAQTDDPEKQSTKVEKMLRRAHMTGRGNTMFMASNFWEPNNKLLAGDFHGNFSMAYTYGVHGVEVEVDTETGQVDVVNYVAAHDIGRAINPMLLDGQAFGGIMQGVGYALTEEMLFDHGRMLNPNFRDYKILTCLDVVPMESLVVETNDPEGPFGAKGVGEPGLVPVAPAISNAIYDAVGVRLRRLPMTPDRVLQAILEKAGRVVG